jgi:hypothetical protein
MLRASRAYPHRPKGLYKVSSWPIPLLQHRTASSCENDIRAGAPRRERVRTPARTLQLQVLQRNERESSPHSDTEGEPRNQSRDSLTIHLLSPLTVKVRVLTLVW